MREPSIRELWYHEDAFGAVNDVGSVTISLVEEVETGFKVEIDYDIIEEDEVVDTCTINGLLWYDEVEDEFHLNADGKMF